MIEELPIPQAWEWLASRELSSIVHGLTTQGFDSPADLIARLQELSEVIATLHGVNTQIYQGKDIAIIHHTIDPVTAEESRPTCAARRRSNTKAGSLSTAEAKPLSTAEAKPLSAVEAGSLSVVEAGPLSVVEVGSPRRRKQLHLPLEGA